LEFVKVAEVSEVPVGEMRKFVLVDREILLVNLEGEIHAIGNRCPHAGGDLSKGSLDQGIITCPRHGSKFDVATGRVVSGPKILFLKLKTGDLPSYEVRTEGTQVQVRLNDT
jgi:3-phenylpropionate/trans-cinnamate dioxygenase ferredoxin subunit